MGRLVLSPVCNPSAKEFPPDWAAASAPWARPSPTASDKPDPIPKRQGHDKKAPGPFDPGAFAMTMPEGSRRPARASYSESGVTPGSAAAALDSTEVACASTTAAAVTLTMPLAVTEGDRM